MTKLCYLEQSTTSNYVLYVLPHPQCAARSGMSEYGECINRCARTSYCPATVTSLELGSMSYYRTTTPSSSWDIHDIHFIIIITWDTPGQLSLSCNCLICGGANGPWPLEHVNSHGGLSNSPGLYKNLFRSAPFLSPYYHLPSLLPSSLLRPACLISTLVCTSSTLAICTYSPTTRSTASVRCWVGCCDTCWRGND